MKVDLNQFSENKDAVQAAIKKVHKVDTGPFNTYDIMAACYGLDSYHRAKKIAAMNYYDVRCNLGTENEPLWVTHDIGHVSEDFKAKLAAENLLRNCQQFLIWTIFLNDEPTRMTVETKPSDKLHVQITASGVHAGEVQKALLDLARNYHPNHFENEYEKSFTHAVMKTSGVARDPLNDIDCVEPYHARFVIFDGKGVIDGENFIDDIEGRFSNRDNEYDEWRSYLLLAEQLRVAELSNYQEDPDAIFHLITKDNEPLQYSGNYITIVQQLVDLSKQGKTIAYLFIELDRD